LNLKPLTFALHILNYFQQIHTILDVVDISVMLLLESATDTCQLSTQVYTPLLDEGEKKPGFDIEP
jgi:hypothetical protein